jgi:hypothetical protein
VRWSVGIEAEGDQVLSREQVVDLADAVGSRDEAVERATEEFAQAVSTAGLPVCPIVRVEAVSEEEDLGG